MTDIAKATLADKEDVARLIRELGQAVGVARDMDANWYRTLRRMIASPEWTFLMAERDKRKVGLLILLVYPSLYYGGNSALITGLIVTEEFRGKGIGEMLVDEAKRIARSQGCEEILFNIKVPSDEAMSFFKKLGFEERQVNYGINL